MRDFLSAVFTAGLLSRVGFIATLVGIGVTVFATANGYVTIKILACIIIVLLFLSATLAVRCFQFYNMYYRRIRVIRQIAGKGSLDGETLLVTSNPGCLRDNVLLTLYSPTSGADQAVGLLQVEKSIAGQDIIARSFPAGAEMVDLSQYFEGDNSTKLYVNPLIHFRDLQRVLEERVKSQIFSQKVEIGEVVIDQ